MAMVSDAGGKKEEIMSAEEVAEFMGVDVQAVRRYAREGQLPSYRIPKTRKFLFIRSEILDHIRQFPAEEDQSRR